MGPFNEVKRIYIDPGFEGKAGPDYVIVSLECPNEPEFKLQIIRIHKKDLLDSAKEIVSTLEK